MKQMKFLALALAAALIAFPAFALDLQQARVTGQVGEKLDGYVAALSSSPAVNSLVSEVNARRKVEYGKISAENGQPVDVVAKLAAPQIIKGLPSGAMFQTASGAWQKR